MMHELTEYLKKLVELSDEYNEKKNGSNFNNLENKNTEAFKNHSLSAVDNSYNNKNENNSQNDLIHREYDFSNSMPTIEYVTYLVKYMENIYNKYLKIMDEDKKNNIQFTDEYKNYNYKENFSQFYIYISQKKNNLNFDDCYHCKNYDEFINIVKKGALSNVQRMKINMIIDFERGHGKFLDRYNNKFIILLEPYKIIFSYNASISNPEFIQIEKEIKSILDKFPKINTIFCTKV